MKIGVLTSSRADFGIYTPLLSALKNDPYFQLEIIAFGMHLSRGHGYTIDEVRAFGVDIVHEIESLLANDDEAGIAKSYALTAERFANFWAAHSFDLVLCLGDRFEMNAAVNAGIPFEVKYAHLHGGETTLGATDNVYRHQITLASEIHFASTEENAKRIKAIKSCDDNIYNVGALSLANIDSLKLPEIEELSSKFGLLPEPFILVTFHPETVSPKRNQGYAEIMIDALTEISKDINLVVTLPNADTHGSIYRSKLQILREENERIILIEHFGRLNYIAAMKYSALMLGNTSSGIIEAASMGKYVVNVGDRQKGRARGENVVDVPFNKADILLEVRHALGLGNYSGENIYKRSNTVSNIVKILKEW